MNVRRKNETRGPLSNDVLTQHANNFRTGAYHDSLLNWHNVNVESFGKINELSTKGFIWAQPLFVSEVSVFDNARNTNVNKDLLVVATSENWLYAFDANQPQSSKEAVVWARQFGCPVPSRSFGDGSGDIYQSTVGILGTPVIDVEIRDKLKGGTIFAVTWVFAPEEFDDNPERAYSHYLIAVDLATGHFRHEVKIARDVEGGGYAAAGKSAVTAAVQGDESHTTVKATFAPNVLAIGAAERAKPRDWMVTDTIRRNGKEFVRFNSSMQLQRPGLLLDDGIIYSAFGARADQDPYHGWVFAHSADTLALKGAFCTSQHGQRAGIWQAAEGIGADNEGNVYVGTGNGDIFPAAGCYGDSLLKLKLGRDGLHLVGFSNAFEELGVEDEDFGASSPTILTGRWMAGGGKDGRFYLFEQQKIDKLGSPGSVKQLFIASYDQQSKRKLKEGEREYTHHIHGSPVVYDAGEEQFLYIWGENELLRAFRFDPRQGIFPHQPNKKNRDAFGRPDAVGEIFCSADGPRDSMHGGFLAISVDKGKSESGIVWASIPAFDNASQRAVIGELRAYKAVDFFRYNYDADAEEPKGHEGNGHGADLVQKDRLITLWSSLCNLERDTAGSYPKFCCPMVANGRVYLPSFEGGGKLLVYGLLGNDKKGGGYDIAFDPQRPSVFDGKRGLVFNGSASVRGSRIRLVERPHLYQAGSVFFKDKVNVRGFSTEFVIESILPDRFDDHHHPEQHGFVFAIQNVSVHALGEPGSGFGYSADKRSSLTRKRKIAKSIAVAFGLRNSVVEFCQNGVFQKEPNMRPSGINLRGKAVIKIAYDGTILTVDLKDQDKDFQFHHEQAVDIEGIVAREAYVGLCGGSAEASGCTIDVIKWRFGP